MLPTISQTYGKNFKDTGCRGKKVKYEQRKYNDYIVSILEVQGLTENQELDFSSKECFSHQAFTVFSTTAQPPLPPKPVAFVLT